MLGLLAGAALAQGIDAPPSAFGPNEGIVRGVDKAAGEIIIRHGPLPELDMPPMTMAFEVNDRSQLDMVKPGDRVRFRVGLVNGRFTVTDLAVK
jgi:Cu/Ag efflux protein CusF